MQSAVTALSSNKCPIVNIAAYKFVVMTKLAELRVELRELTKGAGLKGTILLSPEGINVFTAGSRDGINALLDRIRAIPGLADLEVKESFSEKQPFSRMLVKIKREIIAFGVDGIEPGRYTSPRITAKELKRWLDEKRPVTLLDTRNNYEVQAGTFKGAIPIDLDDFRDFPEAVSRLPEELKGQPIVTFCTGGIRCEKAAPYMEKAGFKNVLQLDGGILKYFEECGGEHYDGTCFVFDQRVAVDPRLQESDLEQCFACQAVLTVEDRKSPHYVAAVSCPHCYQSPEEAMAKLIETRQAAIRQVTSPLPGSLPYENERPINVPLRLDGLELLDFLDAMRTHLSREDWRAAAVDGRLMRAGTPVRPGDVVRAGDRLLHTMPATREPDIAADIRVLYEDDAIVVVNKPAPLPMHPCGRFNRNSLSYILNLAYAPLRLRPAHRLDADTSGVAVLGKTRSVAGRLQPQFEAGKVEKRYLARVVGHPSDEAFECDFALSVAPGPDGVRLPDDAGGPAVTRFRVWERCEDGTSLLEVEPLTGRTNQIRVHLWSLGMPIVGDPIYQPEGRLGGAKTLALGDPPLCLHSSSIAFEHPLTRSIVRFEAPSPGWAIRNAI